MARQKKEVDTRNKFPLYISYKEEVEDVIEDTQGEDGPYSGFRHDQYSYEVLGVSTVKPEKNYYYEQEVLKTELATLPERVFVVVVRYSTGDTFSRSDGRGAIGGVYDTYENSKIVMDQIKDNSYKGEGYTAWTGYFEHLEQVYIEDLRVINYPVDGKVMR